MSLSLTNLQNRFRLFFYFSHKLGECKTKRVKLKLEKMTKLVYSPYYSKVNLGSHVFPMEKYKLIHDRLISEKMAFEKDFIEPKPASDEDILAVHSQDYLFKLKKGTLSPLEILRLELPYSKELVEFFLITCGGTILASQLSLKNGIGVHIGGGFHHAFPDYGEGFCVLNDIAVAVRKLQKENFIKKALIIDCDLHQGNGTAYIFQNDKNIFTFSIHEEMIYPIPKQKSDLDIGLETGVGDEEYLTHLRKHIPKIIQEFRPDFILYIAGADPYKEDQLGHLALTTEGFKKRDEFIIGVAQKYKIPLTIVLAGGYASKLQDTIQIHTNTIKVALKLL